MIWCSIPLNFLQEDLHLQTDTSQLPPSTAQPHPCLLWSQDGGFGEEITSHAPQSVEKPPHPTQSTRGISIDQWEVVHVQADWVEKGAFSATALSVYYVCQNLRKSKFTVTSSLNIIFRKQVKNIGLWFMQPVGGGGYPSIEAEHRTHGQGSGSAHPSRIAPEHGCLCLLFQAGRQFWPVETSRLPDAPQLLPGLTLHGGAFYKVRHECLENGLTVKLNKEGWKVS